MFDGMERFLRDVRCRILGDDMIRRAVVVPCVVLVLTFSSFVYAQFGGQFACTTWLSPGSKTTFYAGALVDPSDGLAIGADLSVPVLGDDNFVWNLPFRGVWLGLSADLALTNRIGVMASAGWLIPSSQTSGSSTDDSGGGISPGFRSLDQFYILDGAVFLNTWASTKLIGGFRWDHLSTNLKLSIPQLGSFVERDNFTFNAYLPYLGVQVDQGGVVVRIIGFPIVPGDVRWAETQQVVGLFAATESRSFRFKSGQFLEVFASYSKKISNRMEIGGFVTFDYLHGRTDFVTPAVVTFIPDEAISWTYNRRYWTMGGSLSWDFNL